MESLRLKKAAILIALLCLLLNGCKLWPERYGYLPAGYSAEVAEDFTAVLYLRNDKGEREKRKVKAKEGWAVSRPETSFNFGEKTNAENK